jgi:EcoRII C terminal
MDKAGIIGKDYRRRKIPLKRLRKSTVSNPVAQQLIAHFRSAIPHNDTIIRRALHDVLTPYSGDIDQIKQNVSRVISDAEAHAHELYKSAQTPALGHALRTVFSGLLLPGRDEVSEPLSPLSLADLVATNAEALDAFFLSVAQGRKSRAGVAVETFFEVLFRAMGYPFEREHVVNGTPDFVFPSVMHFMAHSTDCIIFTSKRTLRERWRQITSEGSRGFVLFLGTLDATIKEADLIEMGQQKINLVVPEHIRRAAYPSFAHVISLERFLCDSLDPAMERWQRNGVALRPSLALR